MTNTLQQKANIAFQDQSIARSAFALLAAPSGKILLMRKNDPKSSEHGHFEMPGGGLDPNESYTKGVIRETKEETGYTITTVQPLITLAHNGKRGETELMMFIGKVDEQFTPKFAQNPVTGEIEHSEYRWFDLEEIVSSCEIHSKQQQDIIARKDTIANIVTALHNTPQSGPTQDI